MKVKPTTHKEWVFPVLSNMENTKIGKYTIHYPNSTEFHTIKREVWGQDCYYFNTEKVNPYIIDIGAHIGISVLYFKDLYPESSIVAFEPQVESFEILKQNVEENILSNVTLINKAVWKEKGFKSFFVDDSDSQWYSNASFLEKSWSGKEKTKRVQVETTTLREHMDKEVDCLKIDTEGSELNILKSINSYLPIIKNIFIEYHPVRNSSPKDIITILEKHFETEVYSEGKKLKKYPLNCLLSIKGTQR